MFMKRRLTIALLIDNRQNRIYIQSKKYRMTLLGSCGTFLFGSIIKVGVPPQIGEENKKERAYLKKSDILFQKGLMVNLVIIESHAVFLSGFQFVAFRFHSVKRDVCSLVSKPTARIKNIPKARRWHEN